MYNVFISEDNKKWEKLPVEIRSMEAAIGFAQDLMETRNANFTKISPVISR